MERREAADASGGLIRPPSLPRGLAPRRPVCSVVILTYNGRDLLARCLASIERHRPDPARLPTAVVVVDNGSSDGTSQWLRRTHPGVRLVRIETNRDFCGAANAGLEAARCPFIQL